jgi:hypothetical protein
MKRAFIIALGIAACSVHVGCQSAGDRATAEVEGDWEGCVVGMFTSDDEAQFPSRGQEGLKAFEAIIDHPIGAVCWFPTWDDPFPTEACQAAREHGALPMLTWELFWPSRDPNNTSGTGPEGFEGMKEVLEGRHDAYIDQYAADARAFGGRVLIRFMHEFNGNWYVWSGNKNGGATGGPEKVVAVWKYVVDRFSEAGADNVRWLWTPHGPSIDLTLDPWNAVANYWPGDKYVDWIGLDAYNFYPKDPWGGQRPFRDFDNCFRALYDACAVLGEQPMMIAEFGTGEFEHEGWSKADWIRDAFHKMKTEYPRVKIFTWFNINKELDWRVNSSPETLEAFQSVMDDPYYIGSPY